MSVDSTGEAAVDHNYKYKKCSDHPPPLGKKVILINKAAGVAQLGEFHKVYSEYWTHWAYLPTFEDDE